MSSKVAPDPSSANPTVPEESAAPVKVDEIDFNMPHCPTVQVATQADPTAEVQPAAQHGQASYSHGRDQTPTYLAGGGRESARRASRMRSYFADPAPQGPAAASSSGGGGAGQGHSKVVPSQQHADVMKKYNIGDCNMLTWDEVVGLLEAAEGAGRRSRADGRGGYGSGTFGFLVGGWRCVSWRGWLLLVLAVTACILVMLGAMTGITWAVVDYLLKEHRQFQLNGVNELLAAGRGPDALVSTRNPELLVVGNALLAKEAYQRALNFQQANTTTTRSGMPDPAAVSVLQTAAYRGSKLRFSSRVDIEVLMELNSVYLESSTGAQLSLRVLGVARVPREASMWGSVVQLLTPAGTLTLDDVVVRFQQGVAPLFKEAGFAVLDADEEEVAGPGRRLTGYYSVWGYFNSIVDIASFDPVDMTSPRLPQTDYLLAARVLEPCTLPDAPGLDRCADPAYSAATAAGGGATAGGAATAGSILAAYEEPEPPPGYLPGTTLVDGQRYMAHRLRYAAFGGLLRSVLTYAGAARYQRVQLVDTLSGRVDAWQEEAHPEDAPLDPGAAVGWCSSFTMVGSAVSELVSLRDLQAASAKYMGDDIKLGRPARKFQYTLKQPAAPPGVDGPSTLTLLFWDAIEDFKPLALELEHPVAGRIILEVESFHLLNASTAPRLPAASFQPPDAAACRRADCMPRLGSAFTAGAGVAATGAAASASSGTTQQAPAGGSSRRRRLQASAPASARANADAVCSVPTRPEALPEVELAPGCVMRQELRATKFVAAAAACDGAAASPVPALPSLKLAGSARMDTCTGTSDGCLAASLDLSLGPDCCGGSAVAQRVLTVLGMGSVSGLQLCGGYDWLQRQGCFAGMSLQPATGSSSSSSSSSFWWGARAEAHAALRFSSCCTWVGGAGAEAYVGVNLGLVQLHASLGMQELAVALPPAAAGAATGSGAAAGAGTAFLRGDVQGLQAAANPNVTNLVLASRALGSFSLPAEYYPFEGYWGRWSDWAYCYREARPGLLRGIPVVGLRLRMDAPTSPDQTALNAVELQCQDGTSARPFSGLYGNWTDWATCPDGAYAVAAKMRVEDPPAALLDGSGYSTTSSSSIRASSGGPLDFTAANSVSLRCSDWTELTPHQGYTGRWREAVACPRGSFVCGLRVRWQREQGDGDDTGMQGMQFVCCTA